MASNGELGKRVASGVAWSISEKIGSALLQIVVSIVVANRVMPIDMGIIAVLAVFTALAQVVVDSGFSQTLIRKSNPDQSDFNAVFRFNIISSLALYIILTAIAPFVADFYGWPMLAKVAPVLFLLLPLNALCVIQNTIMVREFRFAQLSTILLSSSVISGLLAIAMALAGFGIWSLVGQRVSLMATKAILLWWRSPWRPKRVKCSESLHQMAPYSLRLIGTDMITALYNNVAQLFIGTIYSGNALGYFNQAQKLKDMPVNSTMQSIQSVTFPALSKISNDEEKFVVGYKRVLMITAFIIFPIMAGLIATAEQFYTLLLKAEWHPAIPYFRTLCLIGLFYPMAAIAYNVLKVKSDGSIILRLEIAKKVIMTIIFAITIPWSVEAIAWGLVIMSICEMALNLAATKRYTKCSVYSLIKTILPVAILTVAMYLIVMITGATVADLGVATSLTIKICTGIIFYILAAWLTRMQAFDEVREIAKQFLANK